MTKTKHTKTESDTFLAELHRKCTEAADALGRVDAFRLSGPATSTDGNKPLGMLVVNSGNVGVQDGQIFIGLGFVGMGSLQVLSVNKGTALELAARLVDAVRNLP